jgi:hypothetical protein
MELSLRAPSRSTLKVRLFTLFDMDQNTNAEAFDDSRLRRVTAYSRHRDRSYIVFVFLPRAENPTGTS